MDMWALKLKAGGPCLTLRHPLPASLSPFAAAGEIGSLAVGQPARWPRLAVSASGRRSKNNREDGDEEIKNKAFTSGKGDASAPSEDASNRMSQNHGEQKSNGAMYIPSNLSYWRDVRASFVIPKLEQTVDANDPRQTAKDGPAYCLPRKWAHSIPMPESGCVLVATEELDGNSTFERTVILLLRLGSRDAYDGPFGIILNRPLYTKMKHVNPSFAEQATPFGDCSLLFGGPVDMSIFLMRTNDARPIKRFEEVVPGRGGATGCSRWSKDHPKFWPNPVAQSRRAVPGARQASSTRLGAGRLLQQASGDTRWAIDVRHAADRLQRQASGVRRATAAGAASPQGQAAAIRPSRQAARQQRAAGERCGSGRVRGGVTLLPEVRGTDNPRSSRGLHLQSNQSKYYQFEFSNSAHSLYKSRHWR